MRTAPPGHTMVGMERQLPQPDSTMTMLETVADGSIAGLATSLPTYPHPVLKPQLEHV